MTNNLNLNLSVSIFKEGKYFIAYSSALDISTAGKTFEESKKRFNEVVQIFFEETSKKGKLEETLSNLGWQKIKQQWSPPTFISHIQEEIRVQVPA
ncbi:hypothetical protein ISS03_02480 [Patescibacteria group bacterium]|nr:hypothetical protein [Patescibacteria group bacterium]